MKKIEWHLQGNAYVDLACYDLSNGVRFTCALS